MKSKKVIICPHCNTALPNDSEFCTACGEKIIITSKESPDKKWKIAALICSILLIICLCVIGFGTVQFFELQNNNSDLQKQLDTETSQKNNYYNSYIKYKNLYSNLQSKESSYQSDYYDALLDLAWYKNRIAFVVDGSDCYHTKDCYIFKKADAYWAYNIDAARVKGYSECPFCH